MKLKLSKITFDDDQLQFSPLKSDFRHRSAQMQKSNRRTLFHNPRCTIRTDCRRRVNLYILLMRRTNQPTEPVWSSFRATKNGSKLNSSEKWTDDLQVAVIWLMGGEKNTPTSIRHPEKIYLMFCKKKLSFFLQIGVSLCLYHFL